MKAIKTVVITAMAACMVVPPALGAEPNYPSRTIRIIVPFSPGGGNDIIGRLLAQKMQERMGQTVVVENRAGAGGNIGTEAVVRAAPDGYTLLVGANTLTINPNLFKRLPFDISTDLAPIALVARTPMVVVANSALPMQGVADMIKYAQAQKRPLNYASPGIGTPHHFATELFAYLAGIKVNHIPYKGSSPALTSVVAGETDFALAASNSATPFVQAKRLTAIGVTTAQRLPALPTLATLQEQGIKDYDVTVWYSLLAPAKTPREIVDKLSRELNAIVNLPDMQEKFRVAAMEPVTSTPNQLRDLIAADLIRWATVAKAANIVPE